MKFTKRLMSVVLAAVMVIGTLAVSVSADSIYDTAVNLPSGKSQSFTLATGKSKDYKVTLSKKGTLTLNINAKIGNAELYLYDADGNTITPNEYDFTTGSARPRSTYLNCDWNSTTENFKCTVKYELSKGTYFIRFKKWSSSGNGKTTFKATYGSSGNSDSKISYITLEMDKGDTLRLGAVCEPSDADVTWTSSKTDVATVSESGKVTAKKVGKTVITAKCGSSTQKIQIIVV